jgi:hypothetical protein
MIVLRIAAVAAACTAPPFGISDTAVGCGRFDVLADYGTFDVRVRVAVTDGLSGMRLGVALSKPAECGNLADNKPNFVAGFASLDGTACYDRTVTGLRFCPVSVIPNITLLVEPFDLAYPAPLIYNVTFTRVGGCELPPTTCARRAPSPPLRQRVLRAASACRRQ